MKILVIKMSSLGDLFHALPTVHSLKEGLNASVDWVVHDAYADLLKCFEDVDRVIGFPRDSLASGFAEFREEHHGEEGKGQEAGEEIYNIPVSDEEMKSVVESVYGELPEVE